MPENPFKRAIANYNQPVEAVEDTEPEIAEETPEEVPPPAPVSKRKTVKAEPVIVATDKKRGRPATGKRSDSAWIGRTFYIKRETDLDVEELLLKLRREGRDIDKSELVDFLLSAWVEWHKGENLEIQLSEISPIQKGRDSKR